MGIVFNHPNEKKLYIAGDTILYDGVQEVLQKIIREIIIVNGGVNQFLEEGALIVRIDDIYSIQSCLWNRLLKVEN
jgi:hypothetical protein